jgi:hypothetical protein
LPAAHGPDTTPHGSSSNANNDDDDNNETNNIDCHVDKRLSDVFRFVHRASTDDLVVLRPRPPGVRVGSCAEEHHATFPDGEDHPRQLWSSPRGQVPVIPRVCREAREVANRYG